jgi:hypothetical protein
MPDQPYQNGRHDVWTHRIATTAVALGMLVAGVSVCVLELHGRDIPHTITAIATTSLGALVVMLSQIMRSP